MKTTLLLTMLTANLFALANEKKVVFADAESKSPIESVNLTIWTYESSKTIHITTNRDGEVLLPSAATKFTSKRLGYNDLTVSDPSGCADTIFLTSSLCISELNVTATKRNFLIKPDKYVYNVKSDSTLIGKSTFDAFRRIPILNVSLNGNIASMQGKQLVFKLNGLSDPILGTNISSALQSLGAENVVRIELTPDPQGNDQNTLEVNIITKGRIEGYQAIASFSATDYRYRPQLWGITKYKNFCIYGSYYYSNLHYHDVRTKTSEWFDGDDSNEKIYSFQDIKEGGSKSNLHGTEVTASYEFDDNTLLTAFVAVKARPDIRSRNTSTTSIYGDQMELLTQYRKIDQSKSKSIETSVNLDFEKNYGSNGEDGKLYIGYELFSWPYNNIDKVDYEIESCVNPSYLPALGSFSRKKDYPTTWHTLKSDFRRVLGSKHTILASVAYRYRGENYKVVEESSPIADTRLRQHHADASLAYKYTGSQISVMGNFGMKLYHDNIKNKLPESQNCFKTTKSVAEPSITVNYAPDGKMRYVLTYKMYAQVPSVSFLNPYVYHDEALNKQYGNPNIKPQKTHQIAFDSNFDFSRLYLGITLSWQYSGNIITEYSFLDSDNILNSTYGNIASLNGFDLSPFLSWRPKTNTFIRLNTNLNYSHYKSDMLKMSNSGLQFSARLSIEQELPWGIYGQLSASYRTKSIYLQGSGSRNYGFGLELEKRFLARKLKVSIGAENFIPIYFRRSHSYVVADYRRETTTREFNASYSISLSYTIGELKARRKSTEGCISNSDVKRSL